MPLDPNILSFIKGNKKKKFCLFKTFGISYIDYKNGEFLSLFLNDSGKILRRKYTGTSAKFQKKVEKAIKRARQMGILPYRADGIRSELLD